MIAISDLKGELLACAAEAHISDLGFVTAEVYSELEEALKKRPPAEFVSPDPAVRANPFLVMPEARTVIVGFVSYYRNRPRGRISRYACGTDYHRVLPRLFAPLCTLLEEKGFRAQFYTDSWDLDERYLGWRAGLGLIGKNHMLIHPKFGSYGFLGCILTDADIPASEPLAKQCLACGKCISACPGGALSEETFSQDRCVSYLTQKKGELLPGEEEAVRKSGMIWGCDRCQEVCPYNHGIPETEISAFSEVWTEEPDLTLSNRAFRKLYQNCAFSWRGAEPLRRNAALLSKKETDE